MAREQLAAELTLNAALGRGVSRTFDFLDRKVGESLRGLKGFNQNIAGMGKADGVIAGIGRGIGVLASTFRGTNAEIGRTHDQLGALRRRARTFDKAAKDALKAGESTKTWERKLAGVNLELEKQERKLNQLRVARERFDRARTGFAGVRERVAPGIRRAGYAAAGAAIAGGYALGRGVQDYSGLDRALRQLEAEGVAAQEIPLIREQVFKFAETTQFTDIEIADVLVGMKKDGQAVTAELTGVADIMKLAVAESRSLPEAWDATRTLINTTRTDLAEALKLQEQMSNATSVSALNMEQLSYIAGQSLSIYRGIDAFQSADFLALAGALGGILRPERIGTGLREFSLTMAEAAAGTLAKPRQEAFDLLGLNIADEQGRLRDAVSILREFERAFNTSQFKDAEGKIIGDKVQPILGEIFGREALPTIANLLGQSEKIAANIEAINTPGTLERKATVMEQSLGAAANRLKSAVSVATKRFFLALDGDGNFVRMLDSMAGAVQRFSAFITENQENIAQGAETFFRGLGVVAESGLAVGERLFNYFRDRGPAIQQFFKDFWADLKGVWDTLKPIVMGVLDGLKGTLDVAGRLGGGNTKVIAWLAAAFIGWKLLATPITAANAAFNLVLGSIAKVRAAWIGMQGLGAAGEVLPAPRTPKPPANRRGTSAAAEAVKKIRLPAPLLKFGTMLAGFGPMLVGLFAKLSFLAPVVGALGSAFATVGTAIAGVVAGIAGIATLPVAAVVAGVVAVVAGGVALIVANWDKVKLAVGETWDTIALFGSAVWETLKWVGGAVFDLFSNLFGTVDVFLQKFGIDITGVFTGLGEFFSNLFSGIWDGIKSLGGFISEQFGKLLDWIVGLNNALQDFVGGWRDFFKDKNEERDAVAGIKVALPALEPIQTQVDTPAVPNFDITAPSLEPIKTVIEEPTIPTLDITPPSLGIESQKDTPPASTGAGGASGFLDRRRTPRATSVEYVDFAGVDEINKTLKSGFASMLNINSAILDTLRGQPDIPLGAETKTPEISDIKIAGIEERTPEAPDIRRPIVERRTPEVPDIRIPGIEGRTPEAGLNIRTPEVGLNIETSEVPPLEIPSIDVPRPESIDVPRIEREGNIDNRREEKTEITQNITIYQQPNEDAQALTERIMTELERQGRTRYYD